MTEAPSRPHFLGLLGYSGYITLRTLFLPPVSLAGRHFPSQPYFSEEEWTPGVCHSRVSFSVRIPSRDCSGSSKCWSHETASIWLSLAFLGVSGPRVRALVGHGPSLCCADDVHCLREKGKRPCRIQEQGEAWLSGSELCCPLQTSEGQEKGRSQRRRKAYRLQEAHGGYSQIWGGFSCVEGWTRRGGSWEPWLSVRM